MASIHIICQSARTKGSYEWWYEDNKDDAVELELIENEWVLLSTLKVQLSAAELFSYLLDEKLFSYLLDEK